MKILLYSEGKNAFNKSGIGQALRHQKEALTVNGVEFTLDPSDSYDIAHINTIGLKSWQVLNQAQKMGKPVIYHTHTTYEDFKESFKFSNQLAPLIKIWTKKLYNKADYMISPTDYTKNLIEERYLKHPKDIRVISNGINSRIFTRSEELKDKFIEQYNISKPLIITVGLPFERKGIRDFVKMAERCPDYQFFWFGSSGIKPMLPKKVQNIIDNPPKNLVFPGYVEEEMLIGAFSAAKLFLFMTYEENEGIVVLEALSTKLPVLVRDIPVYKNWLIDGKDCLKAKNNDEFYDKIISVVEDKIQNIDEIINGGYRVALDRDLRTIGLKYKEYYQEILNKN